MLHIDRESLELALEVSEGPRLPPPPEIEAPVTRLIERGFLAVEDGVVGITGAGREALVEQGDFGPTTVLGAGRV